MREQWRPIPGYEGDYEVSSEGRFRNMRSGRVTVGAVMPGNGYLQVKLRREGELKFRSIRAHALVLAAFCGVRPAGAITRHINGNRNDNRIANLAWGTVAENCADSKRHGTFRSHYSGKYFDAHPNGKLSRPVVEALNILTAFFHQRDVARIVGVHQSTLSKAIKRLNTSPPNEPIFVVGWNSADANARRERNMGRQGT